MPCDFDRRNTLIHGFDNGPNNRLRVPSKHSIIEVRLAMVAGRVGWKVLAQGLLGSVN